MKTLSMRKDLEQLILYPERKELIFPAERLERIRKKISPAVCDWDQKNGSRLSHLLGFDTWWKQQVLKGDLPSYKALLECGGKENLFFCFRKALENARFGTVFKKWLDYQGLETGFLELGLLNDGEDFNGAAALEIFRPVLNEIGKMAVRRENPLRFTAFRILVHDTGDVSRRILWQGFRDNWSPVRETLCRWYKGPDRDRLYNELFRLMLSDPVRKVRIAARERISSDFSDLYSINPSGLGDYERIHALEHLDSRFTADENAAVGFLVSENREERLTAAHFLERTGTLKRMLGQATLGDRIALERTLKLLSGAVDVGVCRFLDLISEKKEPGILWLGLKLLVLGGRQDLVAPLLKSVLELDPKLPETGEMFVLASETVKCRGDRDSYRILGEALPRLEKHPKLLALLMKDLPEAGAPYFRDILMTWLKDPHTAAREELETLLAGYPPALVIEDCYTLLHDPGETPSAVRKSALMILAGTGESCIIQNVLENLPLVSADEVPGLAAGIKKMAGKKYDELVTRLLETRDTELRCTLLNLLPETGSREHLKFLEEALEDPDTDVRVTAAEAISRMEDKALLNRALLLLHDPEPSVREGAALHFAASGKDAAIAAVKQLLDSEQELTAVRISSIKGLSRASGERCLEILLDHITEPGETGEAVVESLAVREDSDTLEWLSRSFAGALPPVRERLVELFVCMGAPAERGLMVLLKKNDPVLSAPLTEIFDKTGFVPVMANRLKSPFPAERMEACHELLAVGTPESIRFVLAGLRDVKKEIRTFVLNGLKSGINPGGQSLKAVVEMMANDPDPDTRKLAAWTIQRLKA
jgi:hypothetical protein